MSDAQIGAISLKIDRLLAGQDALVERMDALELVTSSILQALQHEQMPMLGTIIEMLEKILAAAGDEKAGGELAKGILQLAAQVEALVEQDGKLIEAVGLLPTLIEESVIRATDPDFRDTPEPE